MTTQRTKTKDPKAEALRAQSCLNPRPETVTDPLFTGSDFFDARDLVQVKYEMLRRVRVDGQPISTSASAFGLSRPTFYQARSAFEHGGLPALLPKKPGPRRSHKLSTEVVRYLGQLLEGDSSLRPVELRDRVRERFGIKVHPRSIERALARQKKKRP
jgi:transposase